MTPSVDLVSPSSLRRRRAALLSTPAAAPGRKARQLVDLGLEVIGCDVTPAMIDLARTLVPGAEFREGRFEALPLDDASVDLAVSSLAVCHLPNSHRRSRSSPGS